MIDLLVTLILFAIVVYVVYLILGMMTMPAPLKNIIYIIVGLILLIVLLEHLGLYHFAR